MLNFLIRDGNLKEWVRTLFVIIGILLVILGIIIDISSLWGYIFFVAGFFVTAIGGYASQAHMLRIRPFDRTHSRRRESYTKPDDSN